MYDSPLDIRVKKIQSNIGEELDNYVMECVSEVGVVVDKDELIKALTYDRNQYEKGYRDGYSAGIDYLCNKVGLRREMVIDEAFDNSDDYDEDDD